MLSGRDALLLICEVVCRCCHKTTSDEFSEFPRQGKPTLCCSCLHDRNRNVPLSPWQQPIHPHPTRGQSCSVGSCGPSLVGVGVGCMGGRGVSSARFFLLEASLFLEQECLYRIPSLLWLQEFGQKEMVGKLRRVQEAYYFFLWLPINVFNRQAADECRISWALHTTRSDLQLCNFLVLRPHVS